MAVPGTGKVQGSEKGLPRVKCAGLELKKGGGLSGDENSSFRGDGGKQIGGESSNYGFTSTMEVPEWA